MGGLIERGTDSGGTIRGRCESNPKSTKHLCQPVREADPLESEVSETGQHSILGPVLNVNLDQMAGYFKDPENFED